MSKEEILESLQDILDEINETSDDNFVDVVFIKETIQDILNQNKEDVSVRKIVRCEDPMVCLRGCSVHEQTCKHPIYGC